MLAYMCTNSALLSFLLNGIFSVWYDLCVTYGLPKMYVTPIFRKGSSWEVSKKTLSSLLPLVALIFSLACTCPPTSGYESLMVGVLMGEKSFKMKNIFFGREQPFFWVKFVTEAHILGYHRNVVELLLIIYNSTISFL